MTSFRDGAPAAGAATRSTARRALDAGERSAATDASGAYRFDDLAAGSYRVAHVAPAGWRRTSGSAAYHDVTLASGQAAAGLNFADVEPVIITGEVFSDRDRNGQVGRRDRGLAGRMVFLDADNDGLADAGERTAVTDTAGYFSFLDLDPGAYTVRVIRLTGETSTSPASGAHSITLLSGDTERLLFGLSIA